METTTQAGAPVEPSIEDRFAAVIMGEPKPVAKAEPNEPPAEPEAEATEEAQSLDQAPTPDDIQDEVTPQPSQGDLEVIHNGQPVKIPATKVAELARQGFDYTQKTQALAEERRAVQAMRQAVQAQTQLHPVYMEAVADARSYEKALQSFSGVNWAQRATDDPIGYTQERARFDSLKDGYQKAVEQVQAVGSQLMQLETQSRQELLRSEFSKAVNAVPAWRDANKFKSDTTAMREYLTELGYTSDEIGNVVDHRHLQILRDAVAYRALVKAKANTNKKVATAPPVAKPGTTQTRQEVNAQAEKDLTRRIRAETDERKRAKLLEQRFASKIKG